MNFLAWLEQSSKDVRAELSYDVLALAHLRPLMTRFGYIAWPRPAMRPGGVCYVVNDVVLNKRRRVVELGCGISTLLFAAVLSEFGGAIISIDEDSDWISFIEAKLKQANLQGAAALIHAPVGTAKVGGRSTRWYAIDRVKQAVEGLHIDVLVVDGPAAYRPGDGEIRYSALPLMADRLAEKCTLILDDSGRRGERSIMRAWSKILSLQPEDLTRSAGIFAWSRGRRYYPGL